MKVRVRSVLLAHFVQDAPEFGILQKFAVAVTSIRGATWVEAGFLLDQAVGVVIEFVVLVASVLDPRAMSIDGHIASNFLISA